ncbi:MAG: hypothetical protein NTZ21_00970 [Actinobacteria bacterium]|nr:hypothetical protein [Actinomycetota bacterium]
MESSRHSARCSTRANRSWARRTVAAVALVAVSSAPVAFELAPATVSAAPAPDTLGAGGEYHPLTPARIYDSRAATAVNEPSPGAKPATPAQPTFDIDLLGVGGIPDRPADVLAVVVNITVTEPTAAGWLNAYGAGASSGLASIVNYTTGQTVPNLSIVRPGANGDLTVKLFTQNASATAHVVVDVFGWFSTSSNADRGARLVPITPGRLLDTREGAGVPLGRAGSVEVQVRGATLSTGQVLGAGSDIVGVVLNVTGINQQADSTGTFLSVVPTLTAGVPPSTSNVNLSRGQIKPNMVIVPVGADGKIRLYNHAGSAHVAVDVAGYLTTTAPGARAGRVVPLTTPYRVFDTRETQWGAVALGPGQAEDWSFADFVNSVRIDGQWVGAQSAVIGNLTSAELKRQYSTVAVSSYLTVYPSDQPRPNASNVNMVEGAPVPNLAIMKYGTASTVRVFNLAGFNHYLYDASAVVLAD